MNRNILKQFALLFSFLLVFVNLSFIQPQVSTAQNLEQAVTISALDSEGKNVIATSAVSINAGDTAWDVLEKVADDLTYDDTDYGPMLTGINDVHADYEQYNNFWSFIVNGDYAAVGASSYPVNHGDNILFLLTDDMGSLSEVTVSAIDHKGNAVLEETSVQLAPYASAFDAIVQAANKQQVKLDVTVHSEYFTFINNIGDQAITSNEWWELSVNNAPLQVGALSHQIQPGEHIQLTLQSFSTGEEDEDSDPIEDEEEQVEENEQPTLPEEKENTKKLYKQVVQEVDFLANYVLNQNLATTYGDEWWVWGLAKSGYNVPASYEKSIQEIVKDNQGEFGNVFDLEKVIIALSNAGGDASNIANVNLVDKLMNHSDIETPLINAAIYALIAANSGDYSIDSEKENALIQLILDSEITGGGWAFFGNDPSADITGMALIALAEYKDRVDVKAAIDRAVSYLSNEQANNGGYYDEWNGGYTSEAVAQVIIGLVSIGVDPTSTLFTKADGKNLVKHLLEFKTSDGLYSHVYGNDESDHFSATPQAFLALSYYQQFVNPEVGQSKPDPNESNGEKPQQENNQNIGKNNENESPKKNESIKKQEKTSNETGEKLPNTKTNIFNILGIGILVLTAGFVFMVLQRKWSSS